nr:histidine kinase [Leucobacter weissii]
MLGINAGSRKRYVAALIDRAHQLAREREQRAELAAAAERSRIAREMHDIVAHSLSVVVTLAEGAAVALDADPAASRQAMQRASETGRSALVEMRRLLGVLRDPAAPGGSTTPEPRAAAPLAPQPGVGQVRDLVAGFAEAGLSVELSEEGVPAGDAAQQLAVYRIAQEGLTNALRYAGPGAEVRVILEHTPERTSLEIGDSGRSGALAGSERDRADGPIPGSGRGLAGVEQRVRIFGGVFEAGPHRGGWRLRAIIPTRGAGREGGGS